MSAPVLAAVVRDAGKAYPVKFIGIFDERNDQYRLGISTGRTNLAFKIANAATEGGRYTPQRDDQLDVLIVNCGEDDFGKVFDCKRVTLLNAIGQPVPALSHRARVQQLTNAFGAKWTALQVVAMYGISGLEGGFSVRYTSTDDVEYTKAVSAKQAAEDLMLVLEP